MSIAVEFPVKSDQTIIPDGFKNLPLDMTRPEFSEIVASGCSCITPVDSPAGWEISRCGRSEPEHLDMFFICSGELLLETENGRISAGKSCVLQILSWHDRYLKSVAPGRHIYVRFNNPEYYPLVNENNVCRSPVADEVDFYIKMLRGSNPEQPDGMRYMRSLAQLLHIIFQRELHMNRFQDHEAVALLQKKLNERRRDFEVLPVAREMGMSFSTFRNFCIRNFGRPPRAVLEEFRMTRARGMLDFTAMSIDEIAEKLGYADRFAFSKAFCRCNQISPAAFRKRYLRN